MKSITFNKNKLLLIFLISLISSYNVNNAQESSNPNKTYEPNWISLSEYETPKWFEDAVLGIYFHWGIYSVPGNSCWTGRNMYMKSGSEWEHVPDGYENTYNY